MQDQATHASGHVFCVQRKRGPQWYCKYRAGGKQVQKRLGPAWPDSGPPPSGYYTKKTAQAALEGILTDARRSTLPGVTGGGETVREAAEEWLRHSEWERGVRASTLSEYRSVVEAHIVRFARGTAFRGGTWHAPSSVYGGFDNRPLPRAAVALYWMERAMWPRLLRLPRWADLELLPR